jgi:drug/metabolite transporter (DMT)-like permease
VRSTITDVLSLTVVMLAIAAGQALFKRVGLAMRGQPILDGFLLIASQPALYVAMAIYGMATLMWIWILSRVPLMEAYPWVAVSMVIVPFVGWFVFGERVSPIFWLGIGLILAGLFLTQAAAQTS